VSDPADVTVVVVDDHPLFRLGMTGLLSTLDGLRVVGQAADSASARAVVDDTVDVVLMDLDLGGESGLDLTRELVRAHPRLAVLVVTMSEDDASVAAALRVGARGYLLKDATPEAVERAVRAVASGEMIMGPRVAARAMAQLAGGRTAVRVPFPELTAREREVLDLIARGHDNAVIARRLVLSPKTVRNHVATILAKLSVSDRAAAVVRAREAGLGLDGDGLSAR
jgi:DNA-binding NarL/FixJ family response regulator